jgi:hypothetical protein
VSDGHLHDAHNVPARIFFSLLRDRFYLKVFYSLSLAYLIKVLCTHGIISRPLYKPLCPFCPFPARTRPFLIRCRRRRCSCSRKLVFETGTKMTLLPLGHVAPPPPPPPPFGLDMPVHWLLVHDICLYVQSRHLLPPTAEMLDHRSVSSH